MIDSFEDAQHFFVVTKMMPAGDLVSYLTKQEHQPLSERHAKKIMLQIARGVQCLHKQLVLHRDLKIQNIYLSDYTEDAKVYIGDYGAAVRLTTPESRANFKIGSPGFMAPEVAEKIPYGFKCDIFSLGCIMHCILFAVCPFWSEE